MEARKSEKVHSTVIITDRFAERRAQRGDTSTPDEAQLEALESGSMVGRYLTLNRIGGGGMGEVYRAHDTELNRTVALKVLPLHLCQNQDYLKRFRTEAQAQARLNSPYVVTLFSTMEHAAGEVLVLEYVEGETLERRLKSRGLLPAGEAVRVFEQTLRGLDHIHKLGVIHRDLKPSNIFITRDEDIKLMDFGVARLLDSQDPTQRGTMVGTLLYISPEQINGRDTDVRSDLYSLGICLFEAVTGRLPFERRSDYALMHAHVQEMPPRPKKLQRTVPPELERVILKAIEKDPDRRYQSADEFHAALLKLDLTERRHRPTGLSADNSDGETTADSQRNKILGGVWLDLSLVATAMLLVLTLGLYPLPKAVPAENLSGASVSRNISKTMAPGLNGRPSPAPGNDSSQAAKPRKDKYETLRHAWGG
jgi:serine/threonine-protein kinase